MTDHYVTLVQQDYDGDEKLLLPTYVIDDITSECSALLMSVVKLV
jgi:hypothetical protein